MSVDSQREQSELFYRTLAEGSPDLIALFDRAQRHLYMNPAAASASERSPSECIGKTMRELGMPDAEAQRWERRLSQVIATGQSLEAEDSLPTPAGMRHFHTRLVPQTDADGTVRSVLSIARDITALKLAEAALRESEDRFKYVFEHSQLGKSITFPTGEIHVNQAFCELLGFSADELRDRRWQEITHPEDIATTQANLDPILSGKRDSCRFVKRYLRKDGSAVWAEVCTSLRRGPAGEPLYFMTTAMDITEGRKILEDLRSENEARKRAEGQIQSQLDELQRWHDVTLGREGRIEELKREVNELCRRVGEPPRYPSQEGEPPVSAGTEKAP